MLKSIYQTLSFFIVMTMLTGAIYPFLVTKVAQVAFQSQSEGDLTLIAKPEREPQWFWPRPRPASNLGPTSEALNEQIKQRRQLLGKDAPIDLLTASGSGLDPHISPQAAYFQVARIAKSRHMDEEKLKRLVQENIEPPQWGFMGQARVNVQKLNNQLPH